MTAGRQSLTKTFISPTRPGPTRHYQFNQPLHSHWINEYPLLDHRVEDPDRRVVFVALQGSRVRTQAGRLIIESADDAEALDVPTGQVSRIVCFGSVGVSAGVRAWAMSNNVDVVFAPRRGSYLGQLVGGSRPEWTGSGPNSPSRQLLSACDLRGDRRREGALAAALRNGNDNMAPGGQGWWQSYRSRLEHVAWEVDQN